MSLTCPECGAPCEGVRCGRCDLPLELISLVNRAADGLAKSAARSLADDRPQRACLLAEESLRLRTRHNDLAAFVAIVTRCAGAAGSLASIPRPRAARLPDGLHGHLSSVLAAMRGPEAEPPPVIEDPQAQERRRLAVPALALAAVVLALASGYIGSWVSGRGEPPTVRLDSGPSPNSLAVPVTASAGPHTSPDDIRPVLAPAVDEDSLDPTMVARAAYLRGLARSRRGLYEGAAADFRIVRRFGDGNSYFYDDAVYYEARALHRMGSFTAAQEAYEHLLSLSTDGRLPYRADARRFLNELLHRGAAEPLTR